MGLWGPAGHRDDLTDQILWSLDRQISDDVGDLVRIGETANGDTL